MRIETDVLPAALAGDRDQAIAWYRNFTLLVRGSRSDLLVRCAASAALGLLHQTILRSLRSKWTQAFRSKRRALRSRLGSSRIVSDWAGEVRATTTSISCRRMLRASECTRCSRPRRGCGCCGIGELFPTEARAQPPSASPPPSTRYSVTAFSSAVSRVEIKPFSAPYRVRCASSVLRKESTPFW